MTWRAKFLTAEDEELLRGPSGRERLDLHEDEGVETLLKRASELGLQIDWRRLNRLRLFLGRRDGSEHYVPPALVEVCRGLARHRNRRFGLVVDPHARTGLLLSALVSEGIARAGVGYNAQENPLVGAITSGLPIALEKTPAPDSGSLVECWSFDDELDDSELDLVVCCPPWGAIPGSRLDDQARLTQPPS